MENERDNSEALWVEDCLAKLNPPAEWRPDSERALQKILKRQQPGLKSSWIRVGSTAAIVTGLFAVLAFLPWHFIWNAATGKRSTVVEPPQAAVPALTPPQPQVPFIVEQRAAPVRSKEEKPVAPVMASPAPSPSQLPPVPVAVQQPEAPPQDQNEKPPERVGKDVSAPSCPKPAVEPSYTDEARSQRVQGTVKLEAIVGVDGTVKVVRIVDGLGYGLDENAKAFVEKFNCKPGMKDGKPVAVAVRVDVYFHLY